MAFTRSLRSASPDLDFRHPGLWLSVVLIAAVLAVAASAFVAALPAETGARSSVASAIEPPASRPPPLNLPGFQRRGTLLTGEVRTQDGSTLRLVIDPRSHAIVGYRLVETPAGTASN